MDVNEFNDVYLNELFDQSYKENNAIFLFGVSDINLLNFNIPPPTNKFLDSLSSSAHLFFSHMLQPSRLNRYSKTLVISFSQNNFSPPKKSCGTKYLSEFLVQ